MISKFKLRTYKLQTNKTQVIRKYFYNRLTIRKIDLKIKSIQINIWMKKKEKVRKNKIIFRWLILKKWNNNINNFKKINKKQSNKQGKLMMKMRISKINEKAKLLKIMNWVRIWDKGLLDKLLLVLINLHRKRLQSRY